jgi:DHA2 family multidrug resistance protein
MAAAAAASGSGPQLTEAGNIQLRGVPLLLAGMVLALSNFMAVLDMTIANVSVPNIAGGLAVSPNEGTWVITSYAVAEAITVPLTGWLAQRFGTVRVYITAIAAFGVCSFLCGLAPSLGFLVLFRIMQGLAGGPMMPLSQTLLQQIVPPKFRAQSMGLWAMTTVVAPIAGPVLGGTISDNMGWEWVFFINVPVAIVLTIAAIRFLASQETKTQKTPIDVVGFFLLIVWVGSLQLMLDKGKDLDWFNSPFIVGCLAVAIVGFIAFLIWELTEEHPVVDIRIFKYRGFAAPCLAMALAFGGMYASLVLIPLWLQLNLGYTATWAGYVTGFNGVLAVIFSPIVAFLVTKVDPRALVSFGILWMAGIMFVRTGFTSDMAYHQLIWPQIAQGLGMPMLFIPLMTVAMGAVKPWEIASAAGLLSFVRTVAGAFATSITTTAWDDGGKEIHAVYAERLNNPDQVLGNMSAGGGLSPEQALTQLNNLVQSQAVMTATNHIFMVTGVVMVISVGAIWLAPRPKGPAPAGGGGH